MKDCTYIYIYINTETIFYDIYKCDWKCINRVYPKYKDRCLKGASN